MGIGSGLDAGGNGGWVVEPVAVSVLVVTVSADFAGFSKTKPFGEAVGCAGGGGGVLFAG